MRVRVRFRSSRALNGCSVSHAPNDDCIRMKRLGTRCDAMPLFCVLPTSFTAHTFSHVSDYNLALTAPAANRTTIRLQPSTSTLDAIITSPSHLPRSKLQRHSQQQPPKQRNHHHRARGRRLRRPGRILHHPLLLRQGRIGQSETVWRCTDAVHALGSAAELGQSGIRSWGEERLSRQLIAIF